jgi:hypothetical protein
MPPTKAPGARGAGSVVAVRLDKPAPGVTAIVHSASGGAIGATVEMYRDGSDPANLTRKRLGRIVYEDIAVGLGLAMPETLFEWVAESMGASAAKRDGAVLRTDATLVVRSERAFKQAFIKEIAFPALDAASKEAGRLTLTLTPASILLDTSPGTPLQAMLGKAKPKPWLASGFRLQIDGLDCSKVALIEPFSVRRPVQEIRSGQGDETMLVPGTVEVPDLRIWVAASGAATWVDWHKAFVVDPNTRGVGVKNGSIELLGPNLKEVLARIKLSGLGIFRLSTDMPADATPTALPRVAADLYCEGMSLEAGSA